MKFLSIIWDSITNIFTGKVQAAHIAMLKDQLSILTKENALLTAERDHLKSENQILKTENENLNQEVVNLKDEVTKCKNINKQTKEAMPNKSNKIPWARRY
jgi:hypothetical protein